MEQSTTFFSLYNPIILSILIVIVAAIITVIYLKFVFIPLKLKHQKDRQQLELKNTRMMALFAELDPDPVFRVDREGKIIHFNESAEKLFAENIFEKNWNTIFEELNYDFRSMINDNRSLTSSFHHNQKDYSVYSNGISYLEIAQIYFRDVTESVKYEKQLKKYQYELKELAAHLEEKLETERQRISRELHDGVGQNLLFLKLKLQQFLSMEPESEADFRLMNEMLENSIKELKEISHNLKPRILEEMGLIPAVSSLVERASKESGIEGSVNITGERRRFNSIIETALFRTVQEAVNNIIKHSGAGKFHIQILFEPQKMRILISDDGTGFDENDKNFKKGMGLINMKERILNLSGIFKIETSENTGTLIIIELKEMGIYEN